MDPQLLSLLEKLLPALTGLAGTWLGQWMARGTAQKQIEAQRAIAEDGRRWDRRVAQVDGFRSGIGRLGALHPRLASYAMVGDVRAGDQILDELANTQAQLVADLSYRAAGLKYPALEQVQHAFAALQEAVTSEANDAVRDPESFKALGPKLLANLEAFRHVVISAHAVCEAYIAGEEPPPLPPGVVALAERHAKRERYRLPDPRIEPQAS